jgi:hypothetical protein
MFPDISQGDLEDSNVVVAASTAGPGRPDTDSPTTTGRPPFCGTNRPPVMVIIDCASSGTASLR